MKLKSFNNLKSYCRCYVMPMHHLYSNAQAWHPLPGKGSEPPIPSLAALRDLSQKTFNWMLLCYFDIIPLFKQLYRCHLQSKKVCENEK